MKETTKNNIVLYAISAAFATTFLIVTLLIAIGLDWLTDKTGWPVSQSFCIIGFVYIVWSIGKAITEFKEEDEKPQSSTPMSYGKELEKRMYEACNRFFAPNTDSNRYSASDLFYAGVKAERDLNTLAWSDEDETVLNNLIYALANDRIGNNRDEYVAWLKSLRPQNQWKPSEEQLEFLQKCIKAYNEVTFPTEVRVLSSLYHDLKKLKEE